MATQLINYVRGIDPELFAVMEKLCMGYSLRAGRGMSGITFLRPIDEPTRLHIFKLANSKIKEEVLEASRLLNALIITENLRTYRDFHDRKDGLTNNLKQKILISKINNRGVLFSNGSSAVLDDKFPQNAKVSKYSLYNMTGLLPTDGDIKSAVNKPRVRRGRGRSAKSQQNAQEQQLSARKIAETHELRHRIIATVAGEYYETLDGKDAETRPDPFVKTSLSLLMFVKRNHPNLYPRLLARTSLEKSDLYLYLQSNADTFLISHDIIEEWNAGDVDLSGMTIAAAVDTVVKDIDDVLYSTESDREHDNTHTKPRVRALEFIDDERDESRGSFNGFEEMSQKYENNLKYIPEKIRSDGYSIEQKMWEDDFRMTCWALFEDVEAAQFDRGLNLLHTLEDTLAKINECMRGNYRSRMRIIDGGEHSAKDIPVFINSIYFIYIPVFDIPEDLDLNPVDEIEPYLEEDSILASSEDIIGSIKQSMGGDVIGSSLTEIEIINALDILIAKKQNNSLTKEETWKITELCESGSTATGN